MNNEDIIIPIAFFVTCVVLALGIPLVRAYIRRHDRKSLEPGIAPEAMQRLERMEQAIDAIAVEVERISEGQRFTTKLLSERAAEPARALPPREPGA
jgi:hypothetical protein